MLKHGLSILFIAAWLLYPAVTVEVWAQDPSDPDYMENSFRELEVEWKQRHQRSRLRQLQAQQESERSQIKEAVEELKGLPQGHQLMDPRQREEFSDVLEAQERYKSREKEIQQLQNRLGEMDLPESTDRLMDLSDDSELQQRLIELGTEQNSAKRQQLMDELNLSTQPTPTSPVREQFWD